MKFIILISLSACVLLSCRRDNNIYPSTIEGSWELRHSVGGLSPVGGTDYLPGNGHIFKFNGSHYETYAAGNLADSGSYSKSKAVSPATGKLMDALILRNELTLYYEINSNIMTLYVGIIAADGAIETFVRQQ